MKVNTETQYDIQLPAGTAVQFKGVELGMEEVHIAYNEKRVDLNAIVKIKTKDFNEEGELEYQLIESTVGRILFNEVVPENAGFFNEVLTKKNLREIIGEILKVTSVPETAEFLDKIKKKSDDKY